MIVALVSDTVFWWEGINKPIHLEEFQIYGLYKNWTTSEWKFALDKG